MDGRVDDAVKMLKTATASNPADGRSFLLLCRAFYSVQQTDDAIHACQTAVKLSPRSSEAQDWMGRAYGARADHAGPISGIHLAHEVHDAFESAVQLDPHNADAVNDLSEYYIGAPGMVGGGLDKAEALAAKVEVDLPQSAHRIRALIAMKHKDYAGAEREYLAAVAVAHRPEAWVDLGGFYKERRQDAKAIDAFQNAIAADRSKGPATVDAASYLIDMQTLPDTALKALQQYLAGPGKSDAAPVVRVHVLIGKLLLAKGDKDGAKSEFNKALKMASNYAPAKRALQGL